jgi:GNAT superfamily N-acetyltransferase
MRGSTGNEGGAPAGLPPPAGEKEAHVPLEIEKGWSLFVADDGGALAAMLALHLPNRYLDQLFVAPEYQGQNLGRRLLAFATASAG